MPASLTVITAAELTTTTGFRDVTALEEHAMFNENAQTIDIDGVPQRVRGMAVTPSFFPLIRVQPVIGRAFTSEEAEIGNESKVILSFDLWQELFNGDSNVVSRTLRMG